MTLGNENATEIDTDAETELILATNSSGNAYGYGFGNDTEDEDDEDEFDFDIGPQTPFQPLRTPAIRVTIISIYSALLGLSIMCNLLIVLFVATRKKMRTVMNIFVANLACADVLMCAFSGIFTPVGMLYIEDWTLGDAICKLIPTTCTISVFVISWSSVLIAAERYWAIVRPHAPRMRVTTALVAGVTVWLVAAVFTLPIAMHQQVVDQDGDGVYVCSEDWGDFIAFRAIYTFTCLTVQYLLPAVFITCAYTTILCVLNRRLKSNMSKVLSSQREIKVEKLKKKQRVTKILVVMIASFMVCWIPLNVFNMLAEYQPRLVGAFRYGTAVFIGCHLMASSSTLLNAVLYAGMNYEFRRQLHLNKLAAKCKCCCRLRFDFGFRSLCPSLFQSDSSRNVNSHTKTAEITRCHAPAETNLLAFSAIAGYTDQNSSI